MGCVKERNWPNPISAEWTRATTVTTVGVLSVRSERQDGIWRLTPAAEIHSLQVRAETNAT